MIVRVRRARGVELAQLKWFVAANVVVAALLMLSFADGADRADVFDILATWSLSLPALAVGVAILRYRLFEIDRLIARTVSWAVVTGLLVGGFARRWSRLQAVLPIHPGPDRRRRRVHARGLRALPAAPPASPIAVDRRFDRARYDAQRTVAEFSDTASRGGRYRDGHDRPARDDPGRGQAHLGAAVDPRGEVVTARFIFVAVAWLAAVAGALLIVPARSGAFAGSSFSCVFTLLALTIVTNATVGAVLILKRPGNVVGAVLVLTADLMAVTLLGWVYGAALGEQRGPHDTLAGLVSVVGTVGFLPSLIVAGPLVAILFPDGRLPSPRWRWPLAAIVAAA